jgi:hypothetical protein
MAITTYDEFQTNYAINNGDIINEKTLNKPSNALKNEIAILHDFIVYMVNGESMQNWDPTINYQSLSVIKHNNIAYIASSDNINSEPPNANWEELSKVDYLKWIERYNYTTGMLAQDTTDKKIYISLSDTNIGATPSADHIKKETTSGDFNYSAVNTDIYVSGATFVTDGVTTTNKIYVTSGTYAGNTYNITGVTEEIITTDGDFGTETANFEIHQERTNWQEFLPTLDENGKILPSYFSNNYTATTAPTVTDDVNAGYNVGSTWFDIVSDPKEIYRCVDNTAGAAVWVQTSLEITELEAALVALDNTTANLPDLGSTTSVKLAIEKLKELIDNNNTALDTRVTTLENNDYTDRADKQIELLDVTAMTRGNGVISTYSLLNDTAPGVSVDDTPQPDGKIVRIKYGNNDTDPEEFLHYEIINGRQRLKRIDHYLVGNALGTPHAADGSERAGYTIMNYSGSNLISTTYTGQGE